MQEVKNDKWLDIPYPFSLYKHYYTIQMHYIPLYTGSLFTNATNCHKSQ